MKRKRPKAALVPLAGALRPVADRPVGLLVQGLLVPDPRITLFGRRSVKAV